MSGEQAKKRRALQGPDKFILIAVGLLIVCSAVLTAMQRGGLTLIHAEMLVYLPALAVFILLGWGAYALFRRIRRRTLRMLVGTLMGVVLVLLLLLAFSYISFFCSLTIPQRCAEVTSPSGAHRLVILRVLDPDESRIEARRAERIAEDPESDPEVTPDDWGYIYTAYPRTMGAFYRSDADVEGEVCLSYAGGGTLLVEWLDDEATAHFYVDDPHTSEGGDFYVHF